MVTQKNAFLAIASLALGLLSLPGLAVAYMFSDVIWLDYGVGTMIAIGFGACTGLVNLLGILFGGLGNFLSRRTPAIIGLVINLTVLIASIVLFF